MGSPYILNIFKGLSIVILSIIIGFYALYDVILNLMLVSTMACTKFSY